MVIRGHGCSKIGYKKMNTFMAIIQIRESWRMVMVKLIPPNYPKFGLLMERWDETWEKTIQS